MNVVFPAKIFAPCYVTFISNIFKFIFGYLISITLDINVIWLKEASGCCFISHSIWFLCSTLSDSVVSLSFFNFQCRYP